VSKIHPAIMRKLELIVSGSKTEAITSPRLPPPCFESRMQYENWLDAVDPEVGSQPPARRDFPAEPNYCRDCNGCARNLMRNTGRCLFPDTVFITVGDGDDEEVVGISKP